MSQQINLFNPLFLKKEKYFSALTMAQSLGLIAIGLALLYAYALVQTRRLEGLAATGESQLALQRAGLARLAGQGEGKLLESQLARLDSEIKARQAALGALHSADFGNTEGFSRYLAAFGRHVVPGVWLTGFSVGESGNDLQIQGRVTQADLVPTYIRALSAEEVMRGRQVVELKLAAKEDAAAAKAAAAGAPGAPGRFVEFSLAAPQRAPEPAPAARGGRS